MIDLISINVCGKNIDRLYDTVKVNIGHYFIHGLAHVRDFISLLFYIAEIALIVKRVDLFLFGMRPTRVWARAHGTREPIRFVAVGLVAPASL